MVDMSFDENTVNRKAKGASDGGQFSNKHNSAPSLGLEETLTAAEPTPADVRNPDFTFESIRRLLGPETDSTLMIDSNGNAVMSWHEDSNYLGRTRHELTIGSNGDITDYQTEYVTAEGNTARYGQQDRLYKFIHQTNLDRLAFAGIYVHGTSNNGGSYGYRFTGGKSESKQYDAAVIAKELRADLKRAQRFGAIRDDLVYSVRCHKYAGGQSIRVEANGLKDDELRVKIDDREAYDSYRRHPQLVELNKTLNVIGNQWQDSEVDSMTDYYNVLYYFRTEFPDERTQQWRKDEKARVKARREQRANTKTAEHNLSSALAEFRSQGRAGL